MTKKIILTVFLFIFAGIGAKSFADLMYSKNFYEKLQTCTPYFQNQIYYTIEIMGRRGGRCVVEEKKLDLVTKQVKGISTCRFNQEQVDEIVAASKEPANKIVSRSVNMPDGSVLTMDNMHPTTMIWQYYLKIPEICENVNTKPY